MSNKSKHPPIMPFYTINQIAKAIGYSHAGAARFIRRLGIPMTMSGGCYYIWISDINVYCPELHASILEAAEANAALGWNGSDQATK